MPSGLFIMFIICMH